MSATDLGRLSGHARTMRREPTEPEKRLWAFLSRSQLGGFKFRRQAVIGHYIADFLCPAMGLIVEVDGETHADAQWDVRRDAALTELGFKVVHIGNADVMHNIEGVLAHLLGTLQAMPMRRAPHPNPSPEEEGLAGI
ncbi:endonuclease domain-containing protein [Sphingomonas parapaucimobilis]|uniref:endonuclease domain-containing protein n=1 Tax=Sphingomonas parapaucimobilis TaxID=28213 RepID=UPI0039192ADE